MYFKLNTPEVSYHIELSNPLNIVVGDSAQGKSTLLRLYKKYGNPKKGYISTDATRVIVSDVDADYISFLPKGALVIIDLDDCDDKDLIDDVVTNGRDDIYYLILGRKNIRRFPVSIRNTFVFKRVSGVTRNVPVLPKMNNILPFSNVYIEDSKSGYEFIKSVYKNTESLKTASSFIKHDNLKSDTLYIFDELGFGGYIEEFLSLTHRSVPYVAWPSFEGFLLENAFHSSLDVNYFNSEQAVTRQLQEYCLMYGKSGWNAKISCTNCKGSCKIDPRDVIQGSEYNWILNSKKSALLGAAMKGYSGTK